jgi:hypothetical protein
VINLKPCVLAKYLNAMEFEEIDTYIYRYLSDGSYRLAFSCVLEDEEESWLVFDAFLLTYNLHNSDDFEETQVDGLRMLSFELVGRSGTSKNLENIFSVLKLVGKHVRVGERDGAGYLSVE